LLPWVFNISEDRMAYQLQHTLAYLEAFKALARSCMTPLVYHEMTSKIERDLLTIDDFQQSVDALVLLDEIRKSGYLLKQSPELVNDLVVPAIQDLIDFLKSK
jgi:hypothetical protein